MSTRRSSQGELDKYLPEAEPYVDGRVINEQLQVQLHRSLEQYVQLTDMFDSTTQRVNVAYATVADLQAQLTEMQRFIYAQHEYTAGLATQLVMNDIVPAERDPDLDMTLPPCPLDCIECCIPNNRNRQRGWGRPTGRSG